MKLEILLSLLAALISAAAAAESISTNDSPADSVLSERSVALNELSRRRKRNSDFKMKRYCCDDAPMSCCQCCKQTATTRRTRTTTPSIESTTQLRVNPTTESKITPLGSRNFTEIVINSEEYWIVIFTFSGPACASCFLLMPIIRQTSILLTQYPRVRLGVFDANYGDHKTYSRNIGITKFPTIYIYANDKEHPYDYGRPKTAVELVNSTIYLITRPKIAIGTCAMDSEPFPTSDVYELIDSNFQETVESCTEAWVVHFYLTWPDACKQFFSVFEEAARELNGRVKFGSFYQSQKAKTPATYGASTKACWVKMFPKGEKGNCVLDFNEGKHNPEFDKTLVSWVEKYLEDEAVQEVCGAETTTHVSEGDDETTMQPRPRPPRPPTTTTRRPTTTTRRSTTRRPTTTTRRPRTTTTTTRRPTTTTTRRPTTTTRRPRTTTTTTTRRPTRPSTTRRRTPTPTLWSTSTTTRRRPIKTTTTSTTPMPPTRVPTEVDREVTFPDTVPPGTNPEPLPEAEVNQDWCQYRCCIVYFLPQQTTCELKCYKNYITTLERVSTRQDTGCKLYFEYQGKRPDFERTFAIFQFPRILVVTTETHTFITRDGTVSEAVLDQYIEAYVLGKIPMKKIPVYVPSPCESAAC